MWALRMKRSKAGAGTSKPFSKVFRPGVISIDAARRVTLANAAFSRMFYLERSEYVSPAALVNLPLRDVIPADVLADLEPLLRRADRMGITAANMELTCPERN